jgi:hypothetical protein
MALVVSDIGILMPTLAANVLTLASSLDAIVLSLQPSQWQMPAQQMHCVPRGVCVGCSPCCLRFEKCLACNVGCLDCRRCKDTWTLIPLSQQQVECSGAGGRSPMWRKLHIPRFPARKFILSG